MGLDIYAGPLCRYYSGDWQTVVQRYAAENQLAFQVVRPGERVGLLGKLASKFRRKPDPVATVVEWRRGLARQMPFVAAEDWEWPEAVDLPYDTDKPDFDGYGAVMLWSAYTTSHDVPRPTQMPADWGSDPAFVEAQGLAQFSHLLRPELWLPVDCGQVFEAAEPNGASPPIGSVFALREQLQAVNEATWKATAEAIDGWRRADFEPESLESMARWGFAILHRLCEFACTHRCPMRLDY